MGTLLSKVRDHRISVRSEVRNEDPMQSDPHTVLTWQTATVDDPMFTDSDLGRIAKLDAGQSVTFSENQIGGGTLVTVTFKRHAP